MGIGGPCGAPGAGEYLGILGEGRLQGSNEPRRSLDLLKVQKPLPNPFHSLIKSGKVTEGVFTLSGGLGALRGCGVVSSGAGPSGGGRGTLPGFLERLPMFSARNALDILVQLADTGVPSRKLFDKVPTCPFYKGDA